MILICEISNMLYTVYQYYQLDTVWPCKHKPINREIYCTCTLYEIFLEEEVWRDKFTKYNLKVSCHEIECQLRR
jgi:hypothetical protein